MSTGAARNKDVFAEKNRIFFGFNRIVKSVCKGPQKAGLDTNRGTTIDAAVHRSASNRLAYLSNDVFAAGDDSGSPSNGGQKKDGSPTVRNIGNDVVCRSSDDRSCRSYSYHAVQIARRRSARASRGWSKRIRMGLALVDYARRYLITAEVERTQFPSLRSSFIQSNVVARSRREV